MRSCPCVRKRPSADLIDHRAGRRRLPTMCRTGVNTVAPTSQRTRDAKRHERYNESRSAVTSGDLHFSAISSFSRAFAAPDTDFLPSAPGSRRQRQSKFGATSTCRAPAQHSIRAVARLTASRLNVSLSNFLCCMALQVSCSGHANTRWALSPCLVDVQGSGCIDHLYH